MADEMKRGKRVPKAKKLHRAQLYVPWIFEIVDNFNLHRDDNLSFLSKIQLDNPLSSMTVMVHTNKPKTTPAP